MLLVMVTGVEGAKASQGKLTAGAHLQSLKLQVLEQSGEKLPHKVEAWSEPFPRNILTSVKLEVAVNFSTFCGPLASAHLQDVSGEVW